MHRALLFAVVIAVGMGACTQSTADTPKELAERHIAYFNDGDLERYLDAYAPGTVIGEVGTRNDQAVADAVAFEMGLSHGTDGYVAVCESWGTNGAKCDGPIHDRLFEPAGLPRSLTTVYQFNDDGEITRHGAQLIHDLDDYLFEREFASWITAQHPELATDLLEYGVLRIPSAPFEQLIPLATAFIEQSPNWPKEPTRG